MAMVTPTSLNDQSLMLKPGFILYFGCDLYLEPPSNRKNLFYPRKKKQQHVFFPTCTCTFTILGRPCLEPFRVHHAFNFGHGPWYVPRQPFVIRGDPKGGSIMGVPQNG